MVHAFGGVQSGWVAILQKCDSIVQQVRTLRVSAETDVLSQVTEVLRLRGSVSGLFTLPSPWGYAMPRTGHAKLLVVTRGRVHFEMTVGTRRAVELSPGDVIALPHGHPYVIRDDPRTPVVPLPDPCPKAGFGAQRTGQTEFVGLMCELAGGQSNPLLRVLPPFIHAPGSDGKVARWLEPTVRLVAAESNGCTPGRTTVLDRLAEVAFIQIIRAWLEGLPDGEGGWLRALRDPQLAPAIEAIHGSAGAAWTVSTLATQAGMSRSAFAARFKTLVGETPLEYLTRWRMQRAAALLETDAAPLKEIVASSGYASEAAFRTVFKKWLGESPGSYRARARLG